MKKTKRIIALIIAILMIVLSTGSISAAQPDAVRINYVVLGDSIASGYGLKNTLDCYAATIAKEKSYYLSNDAVPGHTTDDLLWVVCHNTTARNDLQKADLISISIGGNDLIQFLANSSTSQLFDIMLNGVNASSVKEAAQKVRTNLHNICEEIRSLNSTAPIIFQTQYNPLYANNQYSSYASMADKLAPAFDAVYNELMSDYSNIFVADVYTAFDNYYKATGKYDVIQSDGIHPSESGHDLIAEVILDVVGELEAAGLVPVAAKYYYLLGDADQNGKISISDATTIQKLVAGLLIFNGEAKDLIPDADQNGTVNIKDATTIQKHLASLDSNPNIGTYQPFYG